ncbi:MAG: metallophosphoesterase family protein [Bacillota bacterium]
MPKLLHISDVHLDSRFDGLGLPPDLAAARRAEVRQAFTNLIGLAAAEHVGAVLIAGDLFEHRWVTKATINAVREALHGLGDIPVLIAPGNHDPLVENSYYLTQEWPGNVRVFGRGGDGRAHPGLTAVELPAVGLTVWGYGSYRYDSDEDVLAGATAATALPPAGDRSRRVLLFHGSDTTTAPEGVPLFQPVDPYRAAAAGFGYLALGHYHRPKAKTVDGALVVYPGSPEALNFGEPGDHGAFLVTFDADGPFRAEFRRVGRRNHVTGQVDLTGVAGDDEALARILGAAEPEARATDLFRLTLTGRLDPGLGLDLEDVRRRAAEAFCFIELADETRPDWDLDALGRGDSARALFVREVLAAIEAQPARRPFWEHVLAAGLSAFEGRAVSR